MADIKAWLIPVLVVLLVLAFMALNLVLWVAFIKWAANA